MDPSSPTALISPQSTQAMGPAHFEPQPSPTETFKSPTPENRNNDIPLWPQIPDVGVSCGRELGSTAGNKQTLAVKGSMGFFALIASGFRGALRFQSRVSEPRA